MSNGKPDPVCKAFIVCRQVVTDPQSGEAVLVGLPMGHSHHRFPTAAVLGFFVRLADARGEYEMEVQRQNSSGEVVWRDGPPEPVVMDDPLMNYDLRLNLNVVFPAPGDYEFAVALNGRDVARQRFKAEFVPTGVA